MSEANKTETPTETIGESPIASKLNMFQRMKDEGKTEPKETEFLDIQEKPETEEPDAPKSDAPAADTEDKEEAQETKSVVSKSAIAAKLLGKGAEKLEAIDGDKTVPLDPKLKFKVKPDGEEKEIEFTLKDAVNSFKTRQRIDSSFSALDVERQKLQKEREELAKDKGEISVVDEHLRAIVDATKTGDMAAVYRRLAMMFGEDYEKTLENVVTNTRKWADEFDGKSEGEKAAFWAKVKSDEAAEKTLKQVDAAKKEAAEARFMAYRATQQAKHGVTDAEIMQAWQDIKNKPEVKQLTAEQITDKAISWVLAGRDLKRMDSIIQKKTKGKDSTLQDEILKVLVDLKAYEMKDEEISELIDGVLNDSASGSSEDSEDVSNDSATKSKVKSKGATSSKREHQPSDRAEKGKKRVPLKFSDLYKSE